MTLLIIFKYVHKDLHSGNILQFINQGWRDTKITDLGLAQSAYTSNSSNICGKPYTFASDIYSFGLLWWK